ncbi:MAG TPA: hypothetical protein PLL76_21565, partial [Thermoanaerobaculia bacterium]|nr:hypothetical protein [Thermoanaerobaculia bacterium]
NEALVGRRAEEELIEAITANQMASRLINGLALAPRRSCCGALKKAPGLNEAVRSRALRICLALLATPEPHVGEANEDPLQEHEA